VMIGFIPRSTSSSRKRLAAASASFSEKLVRLAQNMQVGSCMPVRI
jgi:hypothetical protein